MLRRALLLGFCALALAAALFWLTLPDVRPLAREFPKTTAFMERRKAELARGAARARSSSGRPCRCRGSPRASPAPSSSRRTPGSTSTTASTGRPSAAPSERDWEEKRARARRLDDHAAAREEPVSLARPHAVAQAPRMGDRAPARGGALEEADPRALLERHRARPAHLRGRGGVAAILREGRRRR